MHLLLQQHLVAAFAHLSILVILCPTKIHHALHPVGALNMPPPISPKPLRELAQRAVYQHYGHLEMAQHLPKKVITGVVNAQPVFLPVGPPGQMPNGCIVKASDCLLCYRPTNGAISWGIMTGATCALGSFFPTYISTVKAYFAVHGIGWAGFGLAWPFFGASLLAGACVSAHVSGGCIVANKIAHKP